ncbi:hypothetical protein POM88_047444 [Heracleum sosnowskyi]|uniref:Uncharacterized protein n=1 Tax=Heracleum sosnowskyi TaxID=360622 RepID=A0AAD8GTE7_9APIA|nr:hypothetical protein POM88_047444 [Heracleum sosnowskyi]
MSPVLDYEGLAAMIFSELDGDEYVLSLRTFNGDSWTKKFNLQLDHQKIKQVYLYLGVGQFVAGDKNGENIIYDHRKKQTKKLPLSSDKCLDMYTESLVSMRNVATQ